MSVPKNVCVRFTELVCKAVRLAFSCQTSAVSFPFIPIPWEILMDKELAARVEYTIIKLLSKYFTFETEPTLLSNKGAV